MFDRDGYPWMIGTAAAAILLFGVALRLRSWPVWLAAVMVTGVALCVSWYFRIPERVSGLVSIAFAGAGI
jgi:hypothetical protein